MIIDYDQDAHVSVIDEHICGYHKLNPGGTWAGCTCRASYYQRTATAEERASNRKRREERERKHVETLAKLHGLG
jgi:hypothetical protein